MTDTSDDKHGHEEIEELGRRRRRRLAGAVLVLAVVVIVFAFVIQNSQPVAVRFWFVTRHPRLIWVVVGCLVIGIAFGYLLGAPRRRSKEARAGQKKHDHPDPAT